MAEIYRSAAITGTRVLLTQRAERVGSERDKKRDSSADGGRKDAPAAGSRAKAARTDGPEPAAPARGSVVPDAAAVTPRPEETAEPARSQNQPEDVERALQDDLLAILQKRVDQLEEEKLALEARVEVQANEIDTLQQTLDAASADEEQRGYRDGYERGLAEADEAYREKTAALDQSMALFADTLAGQIAEVDRYASNLAFAALARVVGEQYANAAFGQQVIEEALAGVRGSSSVIVRVSQSDFDALQAVQGDLAAAGRFRDLELVADPRVSVGGCLIETENGVWDARLETQLARLKESVQSALQRRDGD